MRQAVFTSSLLGLAATALLAGCPDRTISEVNPAQGRVEYNDNPINPNRNIDILFIIDDSVSMQDKQRNIRENFSKFIDVLNTITGGLPDVHIGVVSSDMGTKATTDGPASAIGQIGNGGCSGTGKNGALQVGMAGAELGTNKFISDIRAVAPATGRVTNYTGDLATVFGKMATLGAGGCGFEQHLEAMRKALQDNPANAGFYRPDAYLAVIFLADEDDCSMAKSAMLGGESPALGPLQSMRCTRFGVTCAVGGQTADAMNQVGTKGQCAPNESSQYLESVQTYVDFLKNLKGGPPPGKVIVAGILGTTDPFQIELRAPPTGGNPQISLAHSCRYRGPNDTEEVADPPTRIKYLLDQFPNRSTFTSICQRDLSGGLQLVAELLKSVIGNACIEGKLADADPVTPGDQYDCSVSWVNNQGTATQTERILPSCASGAAPCWEIRTDALECPSGENRVLFVDRGGQTPPPDTHEIAYCVTVPEDAD